MPHVPPCTPRAPPVHPCMLPRAPHAAISSPLGHPQQPGMEHPGQEAGLATLRESREGLPEVFLDGRFEIRADSHARISHTMTLRGRSSGGGPNYGTMSTVRFVVKCSRNVSHQCCYLTQSRMTEARCDAVIPSVSRYTLTQTIGCSECPM